MIQDELITWEELEPYARAAFKGETVLAFIEDREEGLDGWVKAKITLDIASERANMRAWPNDGDHGYYTTVSKVKVGKQAQIELLNEQIAKIQEEITKLEVEEE